MTKQLLSLFAITLILTSCDPGFAVVLNNNSNKERNVTVSRVSKHELLEKDSIAISDTSQLDVLATRNRQKILVAKDTLHNSYSFVLGSGKRALLDRDIGGPDIRQKIIIDQHDTIALRRDKRTKIHRQFMYTLVSTTIQ